MQAARPPPYSAISVVTAHEGQFALIVVSPSVGNPFRMMRPTMVSVLDGLGTYPCASPAHDLCAVQVPLLSFPRGHISAEVAVLRIVHVLGGVIWAGTSIFLTFFLSPVLKTIGPAAGAVMGGLANRKRFVIIPTIALAVMLAGVRMLMIASSGFQAAYFAAPQGKTYLVGLVGAVAAFVVFMAISHPSLTRVLALGPKMAQASEAERGAMMAEMNGLRARAGKASLVSTVLLITTILAMSLGRYM